MSIIKGKNNIVAGFGGTKRCIGEVYFSQSGLASDNPGALPGWTGEYYENGKTLFPDLYSFVKAHSELQVTKAQYDSAIATYGECPKYVIDENTAQTSLRLPKYARNKRQLVKKEVIGNDWYALYSDGWLEQGGAFQSNDDTNVTVTFPKPFASVDYFPIVGMMQGNQGASTFWVFAIYSKAATNMVVHNATNGNGNWCFWEAKGMGADGAQENTLYPWITAYTSAIPASEAQAAEFTGALSGKANTDLSNVPTGYDYVIEYLVNSDGSWYRKYKSGWLEQGGKSTTVAGGATTTITLLKPYETTSYNVFVQPAGAYTPQGEANNTIPAQTTTTFTITCGQVAAQPFYWETKGQGAN